MIKVISAQQLWDSAVRHYLKNEETPNWFDKNQVGNCIELILNMGQCKASLPLRREVSNEG